jgi:hypothetical protein
MVQVAGPIEKENNKRSAAVLHFNVAEISS